MSLALKLSSLLIRTLSKPIANQIKAQAREHERFRRVCVSVAQALHRFDMRMRLGLLRDSTASGKRAAKDAAEAEVKKHQSTIPTVKTEAQTKAESAAVAKAKEKAQESAKGAPLPRIRPLSEAKAIDSGANFISETFLFAVAGGLIVFESWRSRRKETSRREDVQGRLNELEKLEKSTKVALNALEKELLELRNKDAGHGLKTTKQTSLDPVQVTKQGEHTETTKDKSWLSRLPLSLSFGNGNGGGQAGQPAPNTQAQQTNELNSSSDKLIPNSVTITIPDLPKSPSL